MHLRFQPRGALARQNRIGRRVNTIAIILLLALEVFPQTPDPRPEDVVVQQQIANAFQRISEFEEVKVEVAWGVVRLTGTTLSWTDQEAAAELAASFSGVLYVENEIEAQQALEDRLAPAIEKSREYLRNLKTFLPLLILALVVFLIFWSVSRLVGRMEMPFRRIPFNTLVQNRIRQLVQTIVFFLGILLALEILGVTAIVGAILGTAGVAGIVIGFAFKDIVENYLAGLLLSVRQPFAQNDLIQLAGYTGKVARLTSRETVLLTVDGNHVRLPNSLVFNSPMTNFSRNPLRRFDFSVGVANDEDLRHVQSTGLKTLAEIDGVLDSPAPIVLIEQLGDSSVTVRFAAWVDQRTNDFSKLRSESIRLVKDAFDTAGIEMPEPGYRVLLEKDDASTSKSAPRDSGAQQVDTAVEHHLEQQIERDEEQEGTSSNLLKDQSS